MNSFLRNLFNKGKGKRNIHLDYAATTPVAPEVVRAMKPYLSEQFFNPASGYVDAQRVKKAIAESRIAIARMFQVKDNEVVFTQGGTESNNLAILGLARQALREYDFVPHMIFSEIEHPAVSECIPALREIGVDVDMVSVSAKGIVDVEQLQRLLNDRTVLVSVICVSNEIGTMQPIHKISSVLKKFKNAKGREFSQYPFLHTDASQAVLTEETSASKLGADLISVDGSKIYAPKMTGLLIRKQHVPLEPLVYGGGQEYGLRSGTENAAGIVGLKAALVLAKERRAGDRVHFERLRDALIRELYAQEIPGEVNGSREYCVPHIVNVCIPGLNSDFAVIQLDELGINCSAMTACASAKGVPKSQVIEAIGRPECAGSSLRFSFGRGTKVAHVVEAISKLKIVCSKQRLS